MIPTERWSSGFSLPLFVIFIFIIGTVGCAVVRLLWLLLWPTRMVYRLITAVCGRVGKSLILISSRLKLNLNQYVESFSHRRVKFAINVMSNCSILFIFLLLGILALGGLFNIMFIFSESMQSWIEKSYVDLGILSTSNDVLSEHLQVTHQESYSVFKGKDRFVACSIRAVFTEKIDMPKPSDVIWKRNNEPVQVNFSSDFRVQTSITWISTQSNRHLYVYDITSNLTILKNLAFSGRGSYTCDLKYGDINRPKIKQFFVWKLNEYTVDTSQYHNFVKNVSINPGGVLNYTDSQMAMCPEGQFLTNKV